MLQALSDLLTLHRGFDHAQGTLERHLRVPSCIPDCGICCKVTVPGCMIIEAINMVSVLIGSAGLKPALDAAESWLLSKHQLAAIYRGLPVGVVPADIRAEMQEIGKSRCPFLSDDMKCLIHTCHPLVCRAYGVTIEGRGCPRPLGRDETNSNKGIFEASALRKLVHQFKQFHGERKPEWVIRGFAPTLLFRAAEPAKFRAYVDDNRIASAKIIGSVMDTSLMWQPQLEAMRAGVSGDAMAYAYSTDEPERLLAGLRR